jgi:hypothetical protein
MVEPRDPSHPPSDPYPAVVRARAARFGDETRPPRAQLVAVGLLGVVLLATGVFLWRRPHGLVGAGASDGSGSLALKVAPEDGGFRPGLDADQALKPVLLSEARVVACRDRGPKKTSPDDCDHLSGLEQALSQAIEQAASCVPQSDSGATIEYVADVSFSRHMLRISLPATARSIHDRKVVAACAAAVRDALPASSLDAMKHEHARYRIAITATYRRRG